jgi:uncharacterized phage-associated protein
MYDARVIANEILRMAWETDRDLTQIEVQKIVYFMNGHHLVDHGVPMVSTDFEAWKRGPVQRILYDSFRHYGSAPITQLATSFDPIRRVMKDLPMITSNSVRDTLERYFELYCDIPGNELVGMTHRHATPWSRTIDEAKTSANVGMIIPTAVIAEFFEGIPS